MKPVYERENLIITEFDCEDVITTSGGLLPEDPTDPESAYSTTEMENVYGGYSSFQGPGSWF